MADKKSGKMSASEAGKLGAKAQPREAKVEGGQHSHGGGRRSDNK